MNKFFRNMLACLLLTFSVFSAQNLIDPQEVPHIMNKFFSYHIDKKQMTPQIIRRTIKIYLEQFDPEKIYFTQSEIDSVLNISDSEVNHIIAQYYKGNFEYFEEVSFLIQKGILRAQRFRKSLKNELINRPIQEMDIEFQSGYASNEKELFEKQKYRINRFFLFHDKRSDLNTKKRRKKAFNLFEKKARQGEFVYLFLDSNGNPMTNELANHIFSQKLLKAMAKSLDAHTSFFTENEAFEMRMNLEKQFEGVGIVLSESIDGVLVADLIKNGPAAKSNKIAIDDMIVSINDIDIKNKSFEEVLQMMKARDSSFLKLGVKKAGNSRVIQVRLSKEPIVMEDDRLTFEAEPFGNGVIGKLNLRSFYENGEGINSEKDIRKALHALEKKGPILGLVLDLRENSGGFLSQAVKVAGLFISSGVVVISKYGQEIHYLRKVDVKSYYNGPLIILTSKLSASAAEIVAQALQDYGAGIVVGDERTFGKGSIQYQTVTDENADLFFKVTVGKYYTVSGKSTQVEGVKADIVVPTALSVYNIGEKFLEYPLQPDKVNPAYRDTLLDLDMKTRSWFQQNYLPYLQKQILFWKGMLPTLRANATYRIDQSLTYQKFLESIKVVNDPFYKPHGMDLQMEQAVNILKDMIFLELKTQVDAEKAFSKKDNFQK